MNQKFLLSLVAIPTLTGSILTMLLLPLVAAAETIAPLQKDVFSSELTFCSFPVEPENNPALEYPVLDFSEAESDAAVALFGCDCPACIDTLRQLRSQSLDQLVLNTSRMTGSKQPALRKHLSSFSSQLGANEQLISNQSAPEETIAPSNAPINIAIPHGTQGHCWANLQRRATLEDVQNVLQTLEAEEMSQ